MFNSLFGLGLKIFFEKLFKFVQGIIDQLKRDKLNKQLGAAEQSAATLKEGEKLEKEVEEVASKPAPSDDEFEKRANEGTL